jgi:hypothetical protein
VCDANQQTSNDLVKHHRSSNVGIALNVIEHLFGSYHQLIISIGLKNGSLRDTVFGNSQALVNSAEQHSNVVFGTG